MIEPFERITLTSRKGSEELLSGTGDYRHIRYD